MSSVWSLRSCSASKRGREASANGRRRCSLPRQHRGRRTHLDQSPQLFLVLLDLALSDCESVKVRAQGKASSSARSVGEGRSEGQRSRSLRACSTARRDVPRL